MTFLWIFELFFLLPLLFRDVFSLKNVVLTIEPRVVQRFNSSTLRCLYDLEGVALYSVKWYRGRYEFYRYTPSESPSRKIFPVGGIAVDMSRSNATQVVLQNIEFNLSGKFICEVTTEVTRDMPFSTETDEQSMLVVQLPEYPPVISVGREPLDYGDLLKANCSCSPSRPRATLTFMLHNMTVAQSKPLTPRQFQETAWSDLSLEIELNSYHFMDGKLILRCVAEISEIYKEEAVLRLESAREPVPERVSSFDSSTSLGQDRILYLIIFLCTLLVIS